MIQTHHINFAQSIVKALINEKEILYKIEQKTADQRYTFNALEKVVKELETKINESRGKQ